DRRGGRVMDRGLEPSGVRMPDARQWWMNRPDREIEAAPLELQHFHVAKSLREHGVTRVEIAETHVKLRNCSTGILPVGPMGVSPVVSDWDQGKSGSGKMP